MTPSSHAPPSKRVLEPIERVSEVLFGLIMVLTFTGSLSVAEADRAEVRTMLIGALGCNIAWGIIDGLFYLMGCLAEKGRGIRALRALRALREAATPEEARRLIADALPPPVADSLEPATYDSLREKLARLPDPPPRPRLNRKEWLGACGVFLWVFLTTLPVAIPFLFVDEVGYAIRLSNAIAILLLFLTGHAFGRIAGYHPWRTGLAMVLLGIVLVAVTMALGG